MNTDMFLREPLLPLPLKCLTDRGLKERKIVRDWERGILNISLCV